MRSLLFVLLVAVAWRHPDSLSSTRVTIAGAEVRVQTRCQVLSLLEVVPGLDADADGVVVPAEIAAFEEAIGAYLERHYRLFVGTDRSFEGGRPLDGGLVSVRLQPAGSDEARGFRLGAVDVELVYHAGAPVTDLLVHSTLFEATSPGHIDLTSLVWSDGTTESFALDARQPRRRVDPTGRGALMAFAAMGARHVLSGWDHLAFVLVLVLGARSLRSVVGVVTAFTLAHSVTLALAALGVVDLAHHTDLVEALIALSVAYVAADVALFPDRLRARWVEAFAFGLLHGLGFASFLRTSLVHEASRTTALVGFNLGVEAGQLPVAFAAAFALRAVRGARARGGDGGAGAEEGRSPPQALAPRALRRGLAAVVTIGALVVFAQRV